MAPENPSAADRIEKLFRHLGLERVHLGSCMSGDWGELVTRYGHRICSLTVVAPHLNKGVPDGLRGFESPSLVIAGDQGAPATRARDLAARLGRAELVELRGYTSAAWADTTADRTAEIADALDDFLARAERVCGGTSTITSGGEGEIAGIRYRILGQGPPLVLTPLSLAPSQWDPLVARLADRYSIVVLGGPHLGLISLLEARAASGYGELVAQVLENSSLAPAETVIEAGCGSGALARALARRMTGGGSIFATDINPYLLSEARALAAKDGLLDVITFEQANAEALPYPDSGFDVAFCCTVLEEGDADRMIAELKRAVRPGGRVAIITRAIDLDWWFNLPVPRQLKRKIDAVGPSTGSGVGDRGCADASLYARLTKAGLAPRMMGPQFAIYKDGERLADVLDRLLAALSEPDAVACRESIGHARQDGTLFVAEPFHCAVGIKQELR